MYTLPKLPYDVNALEPYIDGRTVKFTMENTIKLMLTI